MARRGEKIFENPSKAIYWGSDEGTLIHFFKDSILLNDQEIEVSGKGIFANRLSSFLMNRLEMIGVKNHFIDKINMREQLVQFVNPFPFFLKITNVSSGRYVEEFGIEEGVVFDHPMLDFQVPLENKNPVVSENQLLHFNWANETDIAEVKKLGFRINDFLNGFFAAHNLRLVDVRLQFGVVIDEVEEQSYIMLIDEISPETCRIWDAYNNQKLDYQSSSLTSEKAMEIYKELEKRLKSCKQLI